MASTFAYFKQEECDEFQQIMGLSFGDKAAVLSLRHCTFLYCSLSNLTEGLMCYLMSSRGKKNNLKENKNTQKCVVRWSQRL